VSVEYAIRVEQICGLFPRERHPRCGTKHFGKNNERIIQINDDRIVLRFLPSGWAKSLRRWRKYYINSVLI